MRVKIHPNRHKVNAGEAACISVTSLGKTQKTHYVTNILLHDVTFRVQPSGVKRANQEGHRNVHAWAFGTVTRSAQFDNAKWRKVTYHFQEGYFQDFSTGEPVTKAEYLYAVGRDFYYQGAK